MPVNSHSHVNPTWDSGPSDTSTWGVKYNHKSAQGSEPVSKPPLPVSSSYLLSPCRLNIGLSFPLVQPKPLHPTPEQPTSSESKTPSSRLSATTIDVPVFLQPVAYDPASAPPLPEPRQPPSPDVQTSILSPPKPGRLPPPPPQKIPLGQEDMPQAPKPMPQRPRHDPQHSYDDGQQVESQMSQRPRFDPQNSHGAGNRPYQWHNYEQRPTIPVPRFTNFDVESALPPAESQRDPSLSPQQTLPQSASLNQSSDLNRSRAGEFLHKSSISPVGSSDADRWVPTSKPWEPQAPYVPSPEQQNAVLYPLDEHSISTTDLSIDTAGVSTPESHQTSNTSYQENENRQDRGRPDQQSDDSFYWHSGRSSSDTEEDQCQSGSPTATPGDGSVGERSSTINSVDSQREHQDIPLRSTSLSPKISATYGASALGFGGPSDWEYFGDYEAEEIDDEELYSRPRPRDSKSVIEGSTELPVDSSLDFMQPRNESDLHDSDLMPLQNSSLQGTIQSRPLRDKFSQENVVQELRDSVEGDYETDEIPRSVHGPVTPPAASDQTALSSDDLGQQRLDLDDVIRAWSEAPYVGKVHEVAPANGALLNNDEDERAGLAEASLASTPRERMLGVDVILKGAPSLPKLPDSVDPLHADELELERNATNSATLLNAVLTATDHEQQIRTPSNQQEPTTNATLANGQIKSREEEIHTSQSAKITQSILPPVDLVNSFDPALPTPTEQSSNGMSLDADSSTATRRDSRTPIPSQPLKKTTLAYSDGKSHSSSQRNSLELNQQTHILDQPSQETVLTDSNEKSHSSSQRSSSKLDQQTPILDQPSLETTLTGSDEKSHSSSQRNSLKLDQQTHILDQLSQNTTLADPDERSHNSSQRNTLELDQQTHVLNQPSQETTLADSDERSHSSSQRTSLNLDQRTSQKPTPERLESKNEEDCKMVSQEATSEFLQRSGGIISHEATTIVSSDTVESSSREVSPSRQLTASPDRTQEFPCPIVPHDAQQDNIKAEDGIKLRQDHLQEHTKTRSTHVTGDMAPSNDIFTGTAPSSTPPPPASNVSLPLPTPSTRMDTIQDPYSDLDPWGKASLNRFAAMLREESRAETNKDKLNIFNVFTSRESRLRVVLYGTEDELIIPQKQPQQKLETAQKPEKGGFVKQAAERANLIGLERSLKALPALPNNRESVIGLSGNALAPLVIQHSSKSEGQSIDTKIRPSGDDSRSKEASEVSSGPSGDDSYVMVDSPSDEAQYSPGGRPIVPRLLKTVPGTDTESSQDAKPTFEKDSAPSPRSPGSARRTDSRSSETPILVGPEDSGVHRKPAYQSLKYEEGRSEVKNYLANRKSVCRPYATLTQGSLESASTFGREPQVNLAGPPSILTAPTSQYNSSLPVKVDGTIVATTTKKPKALEAEGPTDLRRFVKADFDPLLLALPDSDAVVHESARLQNLRNVMEAVPDDFSFIHQSVVAWDAKAKKQREENDRQRHARQMESEQKIDSLFDDHEIGYGDIAELEIEFKRSEAARKADEDRLEYQTFVSDVFNLVWTRLHYELDQLIPHYEQYSALMDHTLAGKDMFEGSEEGLALGPTMSSFLALHQKLEIRHQKAFEAVLERDRRLKKTELSPWYTLSNIAKVKQLEKQFEDAEKKAIIKYCQQRDARANDLMDVLDQNTLRGVGANQDYMEAIMKAVRRIASGRAFASVPGSNEPTAGLEEVEKAKGITALLASSSEQIVQTFHVADMLLNSADYEVSVAKAKVAKADMATLAKLKEERAKEDQKLMRDLEHRLALIREDSRRTNDEIVKLMLFLGVQNGRADSAPPAPAETVDPNHEARIQKALEEAKRRNAVKEYG